MEDAGAKSKGVMLEWSMVYHALLHSGMTSAAIRNRNSKLQAYGVDIAKEAKAAIELVYKVNPKLLKTAQHSDERHDIFGNPEPKTDILFGTDIRCSVKMLGPIQLASGQGLSTSLVFRRVMTAEKIPQSKMILELLHDLETLPTKLLDESNIPRLKAEKPSVLKEFLTAGGGIRKDGSYQYWLTHNKGALLGHIMELLKKNPSFHKALVREAMTGELLFGKDNKATATHMITAKTFTKIDDTYVSQTMPKTKIDIRAKSRGGITAIAFRFDATG